MEFYSRKKRSTDLRKPLSEEKINAILKTKPQNFDRMKAPKGMRSCPCCFMFLPESDNVTTDMAHEKLHLQECIKLKQLEQKLSALELNEVTKKNPDEIPPQAKDRDLDKRLKNEPKQRIHFQYGVGHFQICSRTGDKQHYGLYQASNTAAAPTPGKIVYLKKKM